MNEKIIPTIYKRWLLWSQQPVNIVQLSQLYWRRHLFGHKCEDCDYYDKISDDDDEIYDDNYGNL